MSSEEVRFELISHASLLFEFGGYKVLTDPWLNGSCYYRSWWHCPAPSRTIESLENVDAIIISHEHPDHFHAPSLKKFPKNIPVWIPKTLFSGFYDRLKALGFTDIREARHGKKYELPGGVSLTNYSCRADDSVFVFDFGGKSWIHFNDCLAGGKLLQRIMRVHPRVHTMFKIYADAEAYPFCYESEDPAQLQNWSRQDIVDSFLDVTAKLKPEYAVPYAGFVRTFHRESSFVNEHLTPAYQVFERAVERNLPFRPEILQPGDRWENGKWSKRPEDPYFESSGFPAREREILPKVEEAYAKETAEPEIFQAFKKYFEGYFRAVPFFLRKAIGMKINFEVTDLGETFSLDFQTREISKTAASPAPVRVKLSSYLLGKGVMDSSWLIVMGSYRVRVWLAKGAREKESLFWMSLFLFDAGYFTLSNYFKPRFWSVLWDRREEFREYAIQFMNGSFSKKSLQGKFNPDFTVGQMSLK